MRWFFLLCLAVAACEDSAEQRQVEQTITALQQAYNGRDAKALIAMVSKEYHETSGTPDPADDMNYQNLQIVLGVTFARAQELEIAIEIEKIKITKNRATVDCIQTTKSMIVMNGAEKWSKNVDQNRIELAKENGSWKILSGL